MHDYEIACQKSYQLTEVHITGITVLTAIIHRSLSGDFSAWNQQENPLRCLNFVSLRVFLGELYEAFGRGFLTLKTQKNVISTLN